MSRLAELPQTAPFAPDEIRDLTRLLAPATPLQRAWLGGFLAGLDAAAPAEAAPLAPPHAPPGARPELTILFATESGNAEALAADARRAATRQGFAARVIDMADVSPADIAGPARNLLVIASTWGEGDPPQRAGAFMRALLAPDAPRFEGVRFAVLALGDRAYARFCETGRRIDERLAELGGARVAGRAECDVDYAAEAAAFTTAALTAFAPATVTPPAEAGATVIPLGAARRTNVVTPSREAPFAAEITAIGSLHGERSDAETLHVELSLAGSGIEYAPGDALGVIPRNDPALVAAVLHATGLAGEAALVEILAAERDITTLSGKLIADYAALTDNPSLADRAGELLPGRQAIDLFEAAPARLAPEQLLGLLRRQPPRYYSIASSRRAVGEAAHLAVAPVRWQSHGRARGGVASTEIADRLRAGEALRVFLKPNPHFRLPADPDRAVIMVGPGTGVAPFRAFLQERAETGACGRNWLFFGHRRYREDFLYQLDWQEFHAAGVLNRIDLAFSRDLPEKIYVQHRMWEARAELFAWLEEGAHLYVCGDAKAMAGDVHATLLRIATEAGIGDAEAWLAALARQGRYLRDVY